MAWEYKGEFQNFSLQNQTVVNLVFKRIEFFQLYSVPKSSSPSVGHHRDFFNRTDNEQKFFQ